MGVPCEDQERQKCPICLDDLFTNSALSSSSSSSQRDNNAVGAVVPCGHCLHSQCFQKWQASSYRKQQQERMFRDAARKNLLQLCKCPMCNMPVQTFVNLFLDNSFHSPQNDSNSNHSRANTAEMMDDETKIVKEEDDSSLTSPSSIHGNNDTSTATTTSYSAMTQELLANHERIKTKLKRYKQRNKSLRQELENERIETEEMLVSTIHNFYKIMDSHEKERKQWTQTAQHLRYELKSTQKQHEQERRDWNIQHKRLVQELQKVKQDCTMADIKVQAATEGLAKLKLDHAKRQSKLNILLQEKSKLVKENRKLKQTVLTSQQHHGSVRAAERF